MNAPLEPHKVVIVGCGQMGQGIAQVCAQAGKRVALVDIDPSRADSALNQIHRRLNRLVEKEQITERDRQFTEQLLGVAALEQSVIDADFVIEAILEDLGKKSQLFTRLDALCPEHTLLMSNTSSVSITKLAAATSRPAQVIGVHFMNPVPLMPLVEIVRGLQTSTATLQTALSFAKALGKTTVVAEDRPGFIVNRILIPMLNEACFALQEGVAELAAIDQAIVLGLHHPMGPLRLADLIGLDTVLAIAEVLHRELGEDKYRPAALLRNLVASRQLGNKTQIGFYDYRLDAANPLPNPALVSRIGFQSS